MLIADNRIITGDAGNGSQGGGFIASRAVPAVVLADLVTVAVRPPPAAGSVVATAAAKPMVLLVGNTITAGSGGAAGNGVDPSASSEAGRKNF